MYQRPYSKKEIYKKLHHKQATKLLQDPVHRWRAEAGIELIHQEPSIEEQLRIWQNWQKMSNEQKEISDKKSLEFFGITNAEHHQKIIESINNNLPNPPWGGGIL